MREPLIMVDHSFFMVDHVDHELRLPVLNESHTNSYTGPRLQWQWQSYVF